MAKLVKKTSITVGKTDVTQFYQLSISQGIFAHHFFKLVCPAEALDGPKGELLSNSKDFVGNDFMVKIEGNEKGVNPFKFAGIVTQVESSRINGHTGDIIISGFSPTLLMDNGPHCNSWEKKALKNIVKDVCDHFAKNLLSPKINPKDSQTLSYTVQYKETAWEFLNRLAATHGEWLFYDGEKIVFGAYTPKTSDVIFGASLSKYNLALQVRPINNLHASYDYLNDKVHEAKPTGIPGIAGLDTTYGQDLFNVANKIFVNYPKNFETGFLTNENQLKANTNIRAAAQASNMVRMTGSSISFGAQLGNVINANEKIGAYTIIEVNHFVDGQGNYQNEFVGIPQSIMVPPVTNYRNPICETQSAIVTENHDTKGLGRVRVRFHWMKPNKQSPWLRITSPHGGGDKGMHFIPEKKEEVIVGFEGNSPTKAFVIGTTYHGKAKQSYSSSGNDKKAIRTRSGIEILMNDSDGSLTITDPSGNVINMDGKKNITITCPETFTVNAKDIKLNAKNNINIDATENLIEEGKVVGITATEGLTETGKNVKINGTTDLNLDTPKLNMKGDETTLNSNKANLNASGDMAMTGAIIKINS